MPTFEIKFSEIAMQQLEELRIMTLCESKTKVIEKAIKLFNYLITEEKRGSKIIIENVINGSTKELTIGDK